MELLRDRGPEFEEAGVRVVAVSRDSPWSHIAWMQALDLEFPLLSDWNGDAVRGFGIAREYRGMREVARRSAFLIERGGTVRGA
jgi:peroxiredoxin